jgi:amidase
MADLHELTATEQVAAIAERRVSSLELVEHYLERIARHDRDINAFVTVLADYARAGAMAADEALAKGDAAGILHGLPLALKDLHPSAGLRTTFGSLVFKDLVPPMDAPSIANLRAAGAVFIGKTNVPEFGPTCYTDNKLMGPTTNPYAPDLSPSGSSGGSAAAVAAGLVGVAHGSDGLGSLRTPAANCGLIGFKTSRGRSAGSGAGWLALPTEGPLARTVADAALFLDAMGGPAASDLWHAPPPARDAFRLAATTPLSRRLRIGRLVSPPTEADVHSDCLAAVDRVVAALEESGHEVVDVPGSAVPAVPEVRAAVKVILGVGLTQTVDLLVPADDRHLLMPYTRWLVETAVDKATDYAAAQGILAAAAIRFNEVLSDYDLILTPTTTAPPLPNAELRIDDGPDCLAVMGRWSAFTPAANIAGVPAVSLPVHHTADGVPIGVQLIAPRFHDEILLSMAAQLEQHFVWQDRHPPVWAS